MKRAVIVFLGLFLAVPMLGYFLPALPASAAVIQCSCYDPIAKISEDFNEEGGDCHAVCSNHRMQEESQRSCLCEDANHVNITVNSLGPDCSVVCSAAGATYKEPAGTVATPLESPTIPILSVPVPGVTFSAPIEANGTISVNFIGQYVNGAYKYLLGFCVTLAIVMVMIGGLQYAMTGGSGDVKKARGRIGNAVIGLVLLLFVATILVTVNPELAFFKALTLTSIPPDPWELENEDDSITGVSLVTTFVSLSEPNITGKGVNQIPSDFGASLTQVAQNMAKRNMGISIASSFRTKEEQINTIKKHCQNPPGSSTCNRKPGQSNACIMPGLDPANCPHTSGRAMDIWGSQSGTQCITQAQCMADISACMNNPCQAALIREMKSEGFCVLASEPWHFERPKMSRTCN